METTTGSVASVTGSVVAAGRKAGCGLKQVTAQRVRLENAEAAVKTAAADQLGWTIVWRTSEESQLLIFEQELKQIQSVRDYYLPLAKTVSII